jgi:hypothetical protein
VPPLTRLALCALTTLLVAASAIALPGAAHGSDSQLSMMMDDDLLLYRGDNVRDQTMTRMKQAGVDVVRVTMLWNVAAEDARSTRQRRRRFNARNPRTYPRTNWDKYDRLVRAAHTLGLQVYFNVTPPAPAFARRRAPRGLRTAVKQAWKPRPTEFAKFVEAVGRRYSGTYRDENDGREVLPRVSIWSLLNEPNQAGWLAPQWERGQMQSAIMARELWLRGRVALDRSGHGRDLIFFAETAPLGSSRRGQRSPVRPKRWLRTFLCENRRGRGCGQFEKFGRVRATGIAHHPYTKDRSPIVRDSHRDSVTMANIADLGVLVDQLASRTRNISAGLPIYATEYGFETNPPDPFSGIPLDRQAEWNVLGDFLAFNNPRVAGITQFLLSDVPPVRGVRRNSKARWFTYQSGIQFANGAPKPAYQAYYFPFLARTAPDGSLFVWGQLRFRPNNLPPGAQDNVQIQYSPDGGASWVPLGAAIPVTNGMGFFNGSVPPPGPGLLRAALIGTEVTSRAQGI